MHLINVDMHLILIVIAGFEICRGQQRYSSYNTIPKNNPNGVGREPDFGGPINNVTVALGREAKLSCIVDNLGSYRVGWMRADTQTILSLHNSVVTHNNRISVTHDAPQTWNLHIRQVKENDRGCYMCQINTATMRKTIGCIDVHVPPNILDSESSGDVTVGDGGSVSLVCSARGYPKPRIIWRREDGDHILMRRPKKERMRVSQVKGPFLNLTRLNRKQMGAYQCIASNDVPPAVVKRIVVSVEFPPSINVVNQLVGSPLGGDLELKCEVEAWPQPILFWKRTDRDNVILNGSKHTVYNDRSSLEQYSTTMSLTIHKLQEDDYVTYTCAARNSINSAEGQIRTYKIDIQTPSPNNNWNRGDRRYDKNSEKKTNAKNDNHWPNVYKMEKNDSKYFTGRKQKGGGQHVPPKEVLVIPSMDTFGGYPPNQRHEYKFFEEFSRAAITSQQTLSVVATCSIFSIFGLRHFLPHHGYGY